MRKRARFFLVLLAFSCLSLSCVKSDELEPSTEKISSTIAQRVSALKSRVASLKRDPLAHAGGSHHGKALSVAIQNEDVVGVWQTGFDRLPQITFASGFISFVISPLGKLDRQYHYPDNQYSPLLPGMGFNTAVIPFSFQRMLSQVADPKKPLKSSGKYVSEIQETGSKYIDMGFHRVIFVAETSQNVFGRGMHFNYGTRKEDTDLRKQIASRKRSFNDSDPFESIASFKRSKHADDAGDDTAEKGNEPAAPEEHEAGSGYSIDEFAKVWQAMAAVFPDVNRFWFQLCSRTIDGQQPDVVAHAFMEAIRLIRETDHGNDRKILVPGLGDPTAAFVNVKQKKNGVNSHQFFKAFTHLVDSNVIFAFEEIFHPHTTSLHRCEKLPIWKCSFADLSKFLRANGRKGIISALSSNYKADMLEHVHHIVTAMKANTNWIGWAWWTAGHDATGSPYNLEPSYDSGTLAWSAAAKMLSGRSKVIGALPDLSAFMGQGGGMPPQNDEADQGNADPTVPDGAAVVEVDDVEQVADLGYDALAADQNAQQLSNPWDNFVDDQGSPVNPSVAEETQEIDTATYDDNGAGYYESPMSNQRELSLDCFNFPDTKCGESESSTLGDIPFRTLFVTGVVLSFIVWYCFVRRQCCMARDSYVKVKPKPPKKPSKGSRSTSESSSYPSSFSEESHDLDDEKFTQWISKETRRREKAKKNKHHDHTS